jgi:hypothetical protein
LTRARRFALALAVAAASTAAAAAVSTTVAADAGGARAAASKALAVRLDPWRFLSGPRPPGWTEAGFDDRTWGGPAAAPFAPRLPVVPGLMPVVESVGTRYELAAGAPLLVRTRFAVAEPARVRVLELAVGYADGFVAYVNGREVARRGVEPWGETFTVSVPHGPEIERIQLAVPSPAIPALQPEGNLLAVAFYAYRGRSTVVPTAPAGSVELAAMTGVRIVRGPYLVAPSEDGNGKSAAVDLLWETDLPASGTVTVDPVDKRGGAPRRITAARGTRQVIHLAGLARGAAYRYRVEVEATPGDRAASASARFETPPAPPAPFRFAIYGDMRYPGHDAHRTVVDALVREAPTVVFNTGDLTDEGSQESNWQRYFEITAPLGAITPVVPALGNHDAARGGAGSALAWSLFRTPAAGPPGWTSLDLGGVHFVVLDTNAMRDARQREWLVDDLASARQRHPRAIFAICHEGPWSHALHGGESRMVHDYAPLLIDGQVDVLFSGHDHIYERGVGTTRAGKLNYIVTGGGGAPLYNPTCAAATGPPPGDVPGPLRPCPPSVIALTKAYHYLLVEVTNDAISICPRRPDRSAVEPCVHLATHHR